MPSMNLKEANESEVVPMLICQLNTTPRDAQMDDNDMYVDFGTSNDENDINNRCNQPRPIKSDNSSQRKNAESNEVESGGNDLKMERGRSCKFSVAAGTSVTEIAQTANSDNSHALEVEAQSFPFTKTKSFWEAIESIDIFKKMPQKPHFLPLFSCKEITREGLAIGYMVTFANLVERTSLLQFDDARGLFEEYLETLLELEDHGFDVQAVRHRLEELLFLKNKREELHGRSKEHASRIGEIHQDNLKSNDMIDDITNQISMLQEKLASLRSAKWRNNSEIDCLKSKVLDIKAQIDNLHFAFDDLVASPW